MNNPLHNKRILVVDDDPDNLYFMQTVLLLFEALPYCFASPREALENLAFSTYDLALLDIQMPGMTGDVLIGRIREHPRPEVATMKAVCVTAHTSSDEQAHFLRAGFDGFLGKPVGLDDLRNEIGRWLVEIAK